MILTILLILIASCYCVMMARLLYGWLIIRKNESLTGTGFPSFAIVVPFRNEELNLEKLLEDLLDQEFAPVEILLVDDHSSDSGNAIVKAAAEKDKRIRLICLEDTEHGKKTAQAKGVRASCADWIAFTDADVSIGKCWLKTMAAAACGDKMFLAGPVRESGKGRLVEIFSEMEFLALAGTGAAGFGLNRPLLCNGANMAVKRLAFPGKDKLPGMEYASGDDVFLLQYLRKNYPQQLAFVKDRQALITTQPEKTLKGLLAQRARWISKNHGVHSAEYVFLSSIVAVTNVCVWCSVILSAFGLLDLTYLILFFIMKTIADYLLLIPLSVFLRRYRYLTILPMFNMVYPGYLAALLIWSFRKEKKWKGIDYK